MEHRNGDIGLSVAGLVVLQGAGLFCFGLASWPAVLVLAGGALLWAGFHQSLSTGNDVKGAGFNLDAAGDGQMADLLKAKADAEITALRLM